MSATLCRNNEVAVAEEFDSYQTYVTSFFREESAVGEPRRGGGCDGERAAVFAGARCVILRVGVRRGSSGRWR